jgi:16S rRNA (cytosine967-C5)-methyltransferase
LYISQLIAADAVHQVFGGRNLTQSLPAALALFPQANAQQKGAAADLSYGTLRFYGEISAYLNQLLEKPPTDERIHALLLVAFYQLQFDKADEFTVVNQVVHAVSQLKRPSAKPWAKGLVNAICRNFIRQKASLAESILHNESAIYSYPVWWIDKLKQQYPEYWKQILLIGNQHPPMTLRVNTKNTAIVEYLRLLNRQNIVATQLSDQAVQLLKPQSVEKVTGFKDGVVSVQDFGAQFAANLLDMKANMRVLDACSAPGGKTGHILELADVQLTSLDNDPERLARVQSNLDRLQLKATLTLGNAGKDNWWDGQFFDRILADVPCSASGIVRRHVDIKWLRRESDIASFTAQQAKILPSLWQKLAKGGKLLYVTCSIFHEENQGQIDQFLSQHKDAKQLSISIDSSNASGSVLAQGGQLIPSDQHDGFFYALLQKQ